jgi:hypothetical protein
MELFLLGAGTGVVGGLIPCPLHLIALTQVAINRWLRAIFVLLVPPLVIDGVLLLFTFFFYQFIPHNISHYVAYVGGVVLIGFAVLSLVEMRQKGKEEVGKSSTFTLASVAAASLTEVSAPGTWIFWLTVAGPILAEGQVKGFWYAAPYFVGSVIGYYGASLVTLFALTWGASLHKSFKARLFWVANVLLLILGFSYLLRAFFTKI